MQKMPQSMSNLKASSLSTVREQNQLPQASAQQRHWPAQPAQPTSAANNPGRQLSQNSASLTAKTVTAGSTTQHVSQGKVKRTLTTKHKLLAKAIKQHHETMAQQSATASLTAGGYQAAPKTLSNNSSSLLGNQPSHGGN